MTSLLTTRDVARLLRLSPATVAEQARCGRLPAVRIGGGAWRFERSAIALLIEDGGERRQGESGEKPVPIALAIDNLFGGAHDGTKRCITRQGCRRKRESDRSDRSDGCCVRSGQGRADHVGKARRIGADIND